MEYYKDLTWQDVRLIVQLADSVLEEIDKKDLLAFGQEVYYKTILERLIKFKEFEQNEGKE